MMKEVDDDDKDIIEHVPVKIGFLITLRQLKEKFQPKIWFANKDWSILVAGQVLSFLLAATGAASATLHFECNLSAPTAQMGLVYFFLSLRAIDCIRNRKIKLSKKKMMIVYPLIAFLDVEANYFTFLAFRYTTLNNVSIFDALAIPSAMICSRLLLRVKYSSFHLYGALICMLGVILNVISDYEDSSNSSDSADDSRIKQEYPHRLLGDAIAIIGGLLHGFRDVMTELAVKQIQHENQDEAEQEEKEELTVDTNEYLGMIGLYAVIISIIQCLLLERDAIQEFYRPQNNSMNNNERWLEDKDIIYAASNSTTYVHTNDDDEYFTNNAWYVVTAKDDDNSTISAADYGGFELPTCSESMGLWILAGYVIVTYATYVGTSRFLVVSEAALLNLSLLTGDLWAVIFSVIAEHIIPKPLFWVALFLIMGGVLMYETCPSPTNTEQEITGTENNTKENPLHNYHNDDDNNSFASSCSGRYSVKSRRTQTSIKGEEGDAIVEFAPSYVVFAEPDKAGGAPRGSRRNEYTKNKHRKTHKQRFRSSRQINQQAASALFLAENHELELVVTV